jgi:hypothetical protein
MITPYTAYTHARDYRVRVRSRYSLDYLEGVFSEVSRKPRSSVVLRPIGHDGTF